MDNVAEVYMNAVCLKQVVREALRSGVENAGQAVSWVRKHYGFREWSDKSVEVYFYILRRP